MKSDGDPRVSLGTAHPLAHPAIALQRRRIFGTGEAKNFKFGTREIFESPISWVTLYPQRGRCQDPGAELLNFKSPSVNF